MKRHRCTVLALILAALCLVAWAPSMADSLKEEAAAAARQTRADLKETKAVLKASGKQAKKDAAQMGKEIKAEFKAAKEDIKKTFTGKRTEGK